MAGTFSGFPQALDILNRLVDGQSKFTAEYVNILADSARQLEVSLGADPLNQFPVATSNYHALTTLGAFLPYLFRMEVGRFEIDLPLNQGDSTSLLTDVDFDYRYPTRFNKTASAGAGSAVPHICLVSFLDPQESQGESNVGAIYSGISSAPHAHVNTVFYTSSSGLPSGVSQYDVRGFTLRNNDNWSDGYQYADSKVVVEYCAIEPNFMR
tara:strand:- start:986 stop:1618 length:633 start_codon:yes stop_codon:yes gene_type:complete